MNRKTSKPINQVFCTKDYSIFKFDRENRDIKEPKVNSLYKSMLVEGWVKGSYAVVGKSGNLIDGQHRVLAAEKAKIFVEYVVESTATSENIRLLNTNSTNWNIIDHLKFHVKKENQSYVLLDRFMKNFPTLRPTECTMLVKNSTRSAERGEFERGEFVVRDMKIAYDWGHKIMSLKPYFEKGYNKAIFVRALVRVLPKPIFNFEEFFHKVKLRPKSIYMCGTVDQYLEMIEDIYNYRRSDKVNLRF